VRGECIDKMEKSFIEVDDATISATTIIVHRR